MEGLCTGVGWEDRALNIELRQDGEKDRFALAVGDEFAIRFVGGRQCIGYRPPGATVSSLVPCPTGERDISAAQCADCFQRAHVLPCLRCTGERCANPRQRPSCVQPENHAVYLASFGPGALKVGVARWTRRQERLAEQGARAAIIIARDDGQQVRRVESQFHRFIGLPDRMSPTEKLTALHHPAEIAKLHAELHEALELARPRVAAKLFAEPEVVELPELPTLSGQPQLLRPNPDFRIRGHINAILGGTLLIDSDTGAQVALEGSSLVGYELAELASEEHGEAQLTLAAY